MEKVASSVLVNPGGGCYHQSQWNWEGNDIIDHSEFWEMMTMLAMVNPGGRQYNGCGESWKMVTPLAMRNLGRR